MNSFAISTQDLAKQYGEVRAVDGLSLRVPEGAVYGFLGRNGAGKTTTIKMLLGLTKPNAGSAQVLGLDIRRDRLAILQRTAYVSENKILFESMNAEELIRFNRSFFPGWSDQAARKYLAQFDIPPRQPFGKLSRGNRTKVYLLLALAQNADLLILDEPTAGLDPVVVDEVLRALIEDHVTRGHTVFFSSHHLAELERVADWIGIIDHGKLLLEARLEDIRTEFRRITASGTALPSGRTPQVLSWTRSDQFWTYVVRRDAESFAAELQRQGGNIVDVSHLNLQEVFLELLRKEEPCTPGNAGATPATVS
jgi:ABC-2 type transport system ATP-binding protein